VERTGESDAEGSAHDDVRRFGVASFPPVLETNAYQRLLYGHLAPYGIDVVPPSRLRAGWLRRSRGKVDVLHFHWLQPYYSRPAGSPAVRSFLTGVRLALFAGRLGLARFLGYRIVWTVHQPIPHESETPHLDRLAALAVSRAAHVLHVHDRATADRTRRLLRLKGDRFEIVPHGSYVGVYPTGRPAGDVRAELGISEQAFVFIAFGLLRKYKDIDVLLDAFGGLDDERAVLVVAGLALDDDVAASIERAAQADSRIKPLLRFIPDEDVAELYGASDAAIVSRADGGTSGALVLALSLGVPVIAAATETYRELTDDGRAGWLFDPADGDGLRAALAEAVSSPESVERKGAAALRIAQELAWPALAPRLARMLRGPASEPPARRKR
jgi:beta-1,4-mannosyltransferase